MSALLCPKCGSVLKWACAFDEGEAYCTALQSRIIIVEGSEPNDPSCNFVGNVRRVNASNVELVFPKKHEVMPPLSASDLLPVECPACGAAKGEPCKPSNDGRVGFHTARVRAAMTEPKP